MEEHPLTIAEVAKILGYKNPQTAKKLIDSGKIKSYGDGRMVRVSPEALKEYMDGNPEHVSEDGGQISAEAQKTLQQYTDDTALAKAQVAKINAEIARDEAVKRRDLPDALAKRRLELEDTHQSLVVREQAIREKEVNQANRDIILNSKAENLNLVAVQSKEYYDQQKLEADNYLKTCRADTDLKVAEALKLAQAEADKILLEAKEKASEIKFSSDELEIELANKTSELSAVETKIVEAQKSLDAIGVKVKAFLPQVVAQATTHYNTARQTSGNVSQYHDQKANQGWDLEKEINKVLKMLGL